MTKNKLRVGLVPMTSTDDWEVNLKSCLKQLSFFEDQAADIIVFPENSLYFNFASSLDAKDALSLDQPLWYPLREWAQSHKTWLHMGGVALAEGGRVFNSSVLINPEGIINSYYQKIHLFDVNVEGKEVNESRSFCAGNQPATMEIRGWKVGFTICYDIRFAELFLHYHKEQVDLIFAPSSFLVPTGRAHWKALLKARAIETQSYVVAPAQVGEHFSVKFPDKQRQTWGQSLVYGPWGELLAETPSYDEDYKSSKPLVVELDPSPIGEVRKQIPVLSHRKL